MEIYNKITGNHLPCAVALGCFDGIHIGHRKVVEHLASYRELGLSSVVFTFSSSPGSFLNGIKEQRIITQNKKKRLLSQMGIDYIYDIQFSDVSDITANEFVSNILVDKLKAKRVVCGFNYHFGHGGQADSNILRKLCLKYDVETEIVNPVKYNNIAVSSTRIRKAISDGDMKSAADMLGRYYSIDSPVVHGYGRGKAMGFPTANQFVEDNIIIPRTGVYASFSYISGKPYYGVTSIGFCPTFGGKNLSIETWFPDYKGYDFYGLYMDVFLIKYIRQELKFKSQDSLKNMIIKDSESAFKIFGNIKA